MITNVEKKGKKVFTISISHSDRPVSAGGTNMKATYRYLANQNNISEDSPEFTREYNTLREELEHNDMVLYTMKDKRVATVQKLYIPSK